MQNMFVSLLPATPPARARSADRAPRSTPMPPRFKICFVASQFLRPAREASVAVRRLHRHGAARLTARAFLALPAR